MLTAEKLVEHLKSKGISFSLMPEDDAAAYLNTRCYCFKLGFYRKLFDKHEGGPKGCQYVNLDFGQLVMFAKLDELLREALLPITLDVGHFIKQPCSAPLPTGMTKPATQSIRTIWTR